MYLGKSYLNETKSINAVNQYNAYKEKYSKQINNSIDGSIVYRDINRPVKKTCHIEFAEMYTNDAIEKYAKYCFINNIGVLNFASFTRPGGGFLKGAHAQEEALCTGSTLYNVLEHFTPEYDYNYLPEHKHDGMYENFAIWSPNIVFETPTGVINNIDVLTCPAPNISHLEDMSSEPLNSNVKYDEYIDVLTDRIRFILDIFKENNNDVLILGAFGCGVFANDPTVVANVFKTLLDTENYNFSNVIFAIPAGKNMDAFKKVFNRY